VKIRASLMAFGVAASLGSAQAFAASTVVKFERGVGVDPVAGVSGTATITNGVAVFPGAVRNDVRGVAPGGRPWTIARLTASVKDDGSISAKGEGLLLAGGDGIGTTGTARFVAASLFCGAPPNAVEFDSQPFPIDASGNFTIRGTLSGIPSSCASPVLLIRNATSNGNPGPLSAWFAAGMPGDSD